jgi:glycosyltransferase involved in cell wall biosynthesis
MKKLLLIQPRLMSYRVGLANDLATRVKLTLAFSPGPSDDGAGEPGALAPTIETRVVETRSWLAGAVCYQTGLLDIVRRDKPDAIVCFANPRYVSFWALLAYARALGVPVYAYGQGLFRHRRPNCLHRAVFLLMLRLSQRYFAYNAFAAASLDGIAPPDKVVALENFFVNPCPASPQERDYHANGILFIGRLRPGCELERLADAVIDYNRQRPAKPLQVRVIGAGQLFSNYRELYRAHPEIVFLGARYTAEEIRELARTCFVACYPGAAGLSVVHSMSLSLATLVHDRLDQHMGPEPAYVVDGETGFHFSMTDPARSLRAVIERVAESRELAAAVGANAYRFYSELSRVRLADRMLEAMQW